MNLLGIIVAAVGAGTNFGLMLHWSRARRWRRFALHSLGFFLSVTGGAAAIVGHR